MRSEMMAESQGFTDVPVDVSETGPQLIVLHQQVLLFGLIHCHQVLVHLLLSVNDKLIMYMYDHSVVTKTTEK